MSTSSTFLTTFTPATAPAAPALRDNVAATDVCQPQHFPVSASVSSASHGQLAQLQQQYLVVHQPHAYQLSQLAPLPVVQGDSNEIAHQQQQQQQQQRQQHQHVAPLPLQQQFPVTANMAFDTMFDNPQAFFGDDNLLSPVGPPIDGPPSLAGLGSSSSDSVELSDIARMYCMDLPFAAVKDEVTSSGNSSAPSPSTVSKSSSAELSDVPTDTVQSVTAVPRVSKRRKRKTATVPATTAEVGGKVESKYNWSVAMLTMPRSEYVRFTRTTKQFTKDQLDDLRRARRRMKNRLYQKDARDRKFIKSTNKRDANIHHLNACVRRLAARCERLEAIIRQHCPDKLSDLKTHVDCHDEVHSTYEIDIQSILRQTDH